MRLWLCHSSDQSWGDSRGWPGRGQGSLRSKDKRPCCSQGVQGDTGGGFKAAEMQDVTPGGAGPSMGRLSTHSWDGSLGAQNSFPHAKTIWQMEPSWGGPGDAEGIGVSVLGLPGMGSHRLLSWCGASPDPSLLLPVRGGPLRDLSRSNPGQIPPGLVSRSGAGGAQCVRQVW